LKYNKRKREGIQIKIIYAVHLLGPLDYRFFIRLAFCRIRLENIIETEATEKLNLQTVRQFCHNCKEDVVAVKDEKGGAVFTCPICGALNEIKYISRRGGTSQSQNAQMVLWLWLTK